jgi:nucleoside-diphosphate-sugar epimerase
MIKFLQILNNRGRLFRILADILMVNFALLLALMLRFAWLVSVEITTVSASHLLANFIRSYISTAGILTLICLLIFYVNGFYTHGRAYRSRYKVLIIIQAVSLSYLTFGVLTYISQGLFYLPRGAFLLAWGSTLVILLTSRLWSNLWREISRTETNGSKLLEKPEKILVIGGAGYIGSALTEELLKRGYKVRLLDLLLFGTEPIKDFIDHPNLEIMQADFRQVDKVVQAVNGVDAIVHLGAIVGDPACAYDEKLTIDVNLMATRMIAEVAKGSGIRRFVFASTCSVYGASDEILDERSILNPISLYARSKIASERVLHELADANFSPTILRFSTIYGFSGRIRFDLVINLLVAKALLENQITVYGGKQWRPFLHVQDASFSIIKALEAPISQIHNETFNVGSNEQNYTIDQIAILIQQAVPPAEIIQMDDNTDNRNYRVNFDRITHLLSFEPKWTVESGISQVIDALSAGKIADYRDAKYSNFKFLREEAASRLVRSYIEDLLAENGYELSPKKTETNLHC